MPDAIVPSAPADAGATPIAAPAPDPVAAALTESEVLSHADQGQAEYGRSMEADVPTHPSLYKVPDVAGADPHAAATLANLQGVAHAEGLSRTEFSQFAVAFGVAQREALNGTQLDESYTARCNDRLRKAWGADYDRQLGFAQSAAKAFIARDPSLHHVFAETVAGSNEFVVRAMATLGQRRAFKSK